MVVVNYEGEFLNVKTCEDSGIYEVKSEGSYVEVEFKGQKKKILNIIYVFLFFWGSSFRW